MATLNVQHETINSNPLDTVEHLIECNDWAFDRSGDNEIAFQVPGTWCDYSLFFAWNEDVGAIHFSCAFDMRVPDERRVLVYELLAMVNEKLWMGHFGVWTDEGLPMYRHAMPMRGTKGPTLGQIEDLIDVAVTISGNSKIFFLFELKSNLCNFDILPISNQYKKSFVDE